MTRIRLSGLVALLTAALAFSPPTHAATNAVRGGIGGIDNGTLVGGDGSGNAQVTLNVTDLALVKQARDTTGQVLAPGALTAVGQDVWFVLYVDNPTIATAEDVRIDDVLDEVAFAYATGSLEMAVLASGATDAATWAAAWTPLTDNSADDAASALDTGGAPGPDRVTLGAVTGQANPVLAIPPGTRLALRFRVRVL